MDTENASGSYAVRLLETSGVSVPPSVPVIAMIDTGASVRVMRQELGAQFGLKATGIIFVHPAASTSIRCPEYSVRLLFPNEITFDTTLIEMPFADQHIG
jgi:hypothetical protein